MFSCIFFFIGTKLSILKFHPMLGGSKNIEALMPMLAGRTRVSNHCCALKLPFLTPKLEPATSQQQGLALGPKAGRGFLQTSHSRNRLEVETGSRSRTPVSTQGKRPYNTKPCQNLCSQLQNKLLRGIIIKKSIIFLYCPVQWP